MPVATGRRKGTHRVTIWAHKRQHEWIVEGSRDEALAFEARERLRLRAAPATDARTAPTFSAFCQSHYRPHAETHLARSTWRLVRRYQVSTLEEFFGGMKLDALTAADVDRYKSWRLTSVSATACNNELRVLRVMLNWARTERAIPVADVRVQMLPVRGTHRVRWWTTEEIGRVYQAARKLEPELLPLLVFLVNTGCRKGEALAAEWTWLDEGTLRIPVTAEWQPKNKRPREVPLSDAVKAALAGPRRHERWIFPSSLGQQFACFPKESFARVLTAARVEGTPHSTRHTFASHFLRSCPDLFLLAQLLGHSHTRTTELYAHLLPDHLGRARNAVNLGPPPVYLAKTLAKEGRKA